MSAAQSQTFLSALPLLETLDDVRNALLQRIPVEHRGLFFTPLHPRDLSLEDLKIDSTELQKAVVLIQTALRTQQRVLIYGDYDCDGVTSTAVLWQTLRTLGLTAQPFVPRRDLYGYGMSVKALQDLWEVQPFDLVITVDNGIVANEAVQWATEHGAKVIITDHHQPNAVLPLADAIVHSSLLCGVGVAWAVSRALDPEVAQTHLDLVAIGTLADQVPLIGANRSLAKFGLAALSQTTRSSLRALAEISGIDLSAMTTSDVTFRLAPRINAMGRLADPMDALRALVSNSPARTTELLTQMERTNSQRQELTQTLYADILARVQADVDQGKTVLVLGGEYHEGIIGLLASKLVEQFQRPAIVVSTEGKIWKASCRSVPGLNIIEALRSIIGVEFASLGGHALAAGFSLTPTRAREDLERIQEQLCEKYTNINQKLTMEGTGTLSFQLLIPQLLDVLSEFEPFGSGNDEPHFILEKIRFSHIKCVGKQKQHWKGELTHSVSGRSSSAIFFRAQEKFKGDPENIQSALVRVLPSSFGSRGFDIQIAQAFPNSQ